MGFGVFIAKMAGEFGHPLVAGLSDMLGYAIHGLGLTPFAVYLSEKFEHCNNTEEVKHEEHTE